MFRLTHLLRRYRQREDGTSTLEFVIMFPLVLVLFIAVFETGVILSRQVLLERSLDEAVRVLRLVRNVTDPATGEPRALTAADIEDAICANTAAIPDCDRVLVVDLEVISRENYKLPDPDVLCVDRMELPVMPANQFNQGANNSLVLVQVCAVVERMLPLSGFGLNLTRDDTGGLHMVASSLFVNEPN